MNRFSRLAVVGLTICIFALSISAQQPPQQQQQPQQRRISPHEVISSVISNDRVMVIYGRPYTKDPRSGEIRKIWGGLVPFDKIWRTGADEATLITTEVPITLGGATVPAGAYSLWTLPAADGSAKLIVNKQVGQWGLDERGWHKVYDQANDIVRADLKKTDLPDSVDQFTIAITSDPDVAGGGLITLKWEKTQFAVPFTLAK